MRARTSWLVLVAVGAVVGAGAPAQAATRLAVTRVGAPPATAVAGSSFTVAGRLANPGRRAVRVATSVTLRRTARSRAVHRVGAGRALSVPARGTRAFRIRVVVPRLPVGRSYALVVCVRPVERAGRVCRGAARTVLIVAAAAGGGSGVAPAAGSGAGPGSGPGSGAGSGSGGAAPGTGETGQSGATGAGGATGATGSSGPTGPAGPAFTPGARSGGDTLFPTIGNGGYDALRYDLALDYVPATKVLQGVATMTARATQGLSSFSLDLEDFLTVTSVRVDGVAASFAREPKELVVTPAAGIPSGQEFTVVTTYGGVEQPVIDPDGSEEGWVPTADGATVLNEPIGAQGWFPGNNTPADKALYDLRITVPEDRVALGNGRLVSNTVAGGRRTFHWREDSPMATYLTTASIGDFSLDVDTTTNPARPFALAIDNGYSAANRATAVAEQGRAPAMLDFFARTYTPYPFTSAGAVVESSDVGYSLETQTKPTYPSATIGVATISHENAHGWFGDSVSPRVWKDIWLNEGMTEFSSWLWQEREDGGMTTKQRFDANYLPSPVFWKVPPAAPPTAADIFDTDAMYTRGAMVCEALRQILGEATFLTVQRAWLTEHRHGNGTTAEWIATVERLGGKDPAKLDTFFQEWLYTSYPRGLELRPGINPSNFDTYVPGNGLGTPGLPR